MIDHADRRVDVVLSSRADPLHLPVDHLLDAGVVIRGVEGRRAANVIILGRQHAELVLHRVLD